MTDCVRFASTIEVYVGGTIAESALGPLLAHCRGCQECRQLLEQHRDLAALASEILEPDAREFDALRRRVLDRVGPLPGVSARPPARGMAWPLPIGPWRAAAALAGGVLLFAAGLAAGHALAGRAGGEADVTSRLVTMIAADAASNHRLTDVEESRFTYSNVVFRRVDGDDVAADFDVTMHVQVVQPARSELVRELLVHALLDPSSTGARLKALSYARGAHEPKIRDGLIFAMRHDANLAVRLRALEILSAGSPEPEVESAVLTSLREDAAVQMRLLALDYLAAHSIDRGRLRDAIQESEQPGKEALLVRLAGHGKRF